MPGRSYNLNSYRFSYQGQEKAVGTNWQNFDLRMHNSDLGRWFQPDPKGQFYSPYISMGNNPVSGIDPDGGYYTGNTTVSYHYGQGYMSDLEYAWTKASWTFGGKSYLNDYDFTEAYKHRNDGGESMQDWLNIESDRLGPAYDDPGHGRGLSDALTENAMKPHYADPDFSHVAGLQRGRALLAGWRADEALRTTNSILKDGTSTNRNGVFTHKVKTPSISPQRLTFEALYQVGQNDVVLNCDFKAFNDKIVIWYDDGEHPGFELLYASTAAGEYMGHNFNLSTRLGAPNLTGSTLFISIEANPTTLTSIWNYQFTNTGGSFLGSNYFFEPNDWQGWGTINWLNKNITW